jgi:hypothetical protein
LSWAFGLRHCKAGFEARGHREEMSHVLRIQIELERHPEIGWRVRDEFSTDDPDDEIRLAIELDGRSHRGRVRAEAVFPQAVAENCETAAVRAVFRSGEGAAGNHRGAEHGEVVCGNMNGLHLLRMIAAGDVHAGAAEVVGGDLLEDTRLLTPESELRNVCAGKRPVRAGVHQLHQRLRVGISQRLEQNGVDDGEDGGVDTDTDSDDKNGDHRESRRFPEGTKGEAQIARHVTDPWE